jgi:predicted transcriptional regulator
MKTQDEALTKSFSIRISVEMLDTLRQVARQHNRSIHGEILTALAQYIKKSQKEQRKS